MPPDQEQLLSDFSSVPSSTDSGTILGLTKQNNRKSGPNILQSVGKREEMLQEHEKQMLIDQEGGPSSL